MKTFISSWYFQMKCFQDEIYFLYRNIFSSKYNLKKDGPEYFVQLFKRFKYIDQNKTYYVCI